MDLDGKELVIQPSSFANTMSLKYHIGKALSMKDLDIGSVKINEVDPLKSDVGSETIGMLLENAISVATDPKVMASLFKCCEKVVMLDNDLINESFFNKIENRGYYYPIMIEVIKVNIMPFFDKISSMFTEAGELMAKLQKSK